MVDNHSPAKRSAEESASDNPSKRCRYDYEEVITILVGPEERRFIAHKDNICEKSDFFRAASSKRRREGQKTIVRLSNIRAPYMFPVYLDWVYTNDITVDKIAFLLDGCFIAKELVELYLLGDVLKDVKLRNKALLLLSTHFKKWGLDINFRQFHTIWEHTASDSSIRKMIVDYFVTKESATVLKQHNAELPADFAFQAALMLMDRYAKKDEPVDMKALDERVESYMEAETDA